MKSMIYQYKNIPTLVLGYNRPDKIKKVIKKLLVLEIQNLYFVIDGPKNSEDKIKISKIAEQIKKIPKNYKVKTLFRKKNLGCALSVSNGITWFFENNKFGIILEDDCLPTLNFFNFCDFISKKYHKNKSIFGISGTNFIPNKLKIFDRESDYYISKYIHVWGWATWKDRWINFDLQKYLITRNKKFECLNHNENLYWKNIFQRCLENKINSWAYPLQAMIFNKNYKVIVSSDRLIKNIGFDKFSTNTKKRYKNTNIKKFHNNKSINNWKFINRKYYDNIDFLFHYSGISYFYPIKKILSLRRLINE